MLLALDTATSAVTVAVHDGRQVVAEQTELDTRRHTELLAPTMRAVLDRAHISPDELSAVAVGVGPGPFTGLRVGIVTATTLGYVLGVAVRGVCSLDAIAEEVCQRGEFDDLAEFVVATDARRREVYWAHYRRTDALDRFPTRVGAPQVGAAADLPADLRALPCAGRGPVLYPDALGPSLGVLDVSGAALAVLAHRATEQGEPMLEPRPLYLRRPDATAPPPRVPAAP